MGHRCSNIATASHVHFGPTHSELAQAISAKLDSRAKSFLAWKFMIVVLKVSICNFDTPCRHLPLVSFILFMVFVARSECCVDLSIKLLFTDIILSFLPGIWLLLIEGQKDA